MTRVDGSRIEHVDIRVDDPAREGVAAFVNHHLEHAMRNSPPESMHALGIDELRRSDVTFWTAWEGEELLGCGALLELAPDHGEIKSMRTSDRHRRRGIANQVLAHILDEASRRGYRRVSLETGTSPHFDAARELYRRSGFRETGPFADYVEDPNSAFMVKHLQGTA